MHSFGYRANALLTFSVTILGLMCAMASVSDNFNSPSPTANVQVLNINRFQKKSGGDDEVGMTLDISANLQSLFTWNTKQVFVFLAAEYATPKNSLNQNYKVTIAAFVPPIVLAIAKSPVVGEYDLSSIRMVMSGAAPMGKELEDTVGAMLPNAKLGQGYGMTEAGPVLSMCLAFAKEPFSMKSGASGTVVRNAEMKIVHPVSGASLPKNEHGEICIRGDQIMKGYLNDPEATRIAIDEEGWLHTGDIGYIDEDDEIFIVDRMKELIKYKGFQVAPAELEALLIAHDNISDAAVVSMKDEVAGEVPVAFVVRANDSEITGEDIKHYISKQVVFYKRIARVFFIDAIPKSPTGKILRNDLRAKVASGFPN